MTEREYIDATNLAKVRAAMLVLREFLPFERPVIDGHYAEAMRSLGKCQEELSSVVKCKPEA
jgi:hypothetical protein